MTDPMAGIPDEIRAAASRLVAGRLTQGLPLEVTDPATVARIAALLRSSTSSRPPER